MIPLFELLIFATEITNNSFADLLTEQNLTEEYENYREHHRNQPITINKTIWGRFIANHPQQGTVLNNLNLEELINQQIKKSLSEYKFPLEEETFYDSSEELEEMEIEEPQPGCRDPIEGSHKDVVITKCEEASSNECRRQHRESSLQHRCGDPIGGLESRPSPIYKPMRQDQD